MAAELLGLSTSVSSLIDQPSTTTTTTTTTNSTTTTQQHVQETPTTTKIATLNTTEEVFHHDGSQDAQVAAICMTLLLILLLFSVLYSRMWRLREEWNSDVTIVPKDDLFTGGSQVNLKQLIQTKLRHLRHIIVRKKRRQKSESALYQRLETQDTDSDTEQELFVSNHVR